MVQRQYEAEAEATAEEVAARTKVIPRCTSHPLPAVDCEVTTELQRLFDDIEVP